jgi:putative redox protein
MTGQSRRIEFTGSQGEPLAARLDLPESTPRAYAVFAHCFTCSKDTLAAARISRALTDFGIAVLRFDFTGLGASGGDFANTNFSSNVEDLVCAADHLREQFAAPSILIGHSLGGAAVLAVAHQVPEVRAVATIGAPADPGHIAHLFRDGHADIDERGEAEVCLAGRTFRIRRQFLDDIAAQPQADHIRRLGSALLVLHSPTDETVEVDNARRIFDTARHPKSFVAIDGARSPAHPPRRRHLRRHRARGVGRPLHRRPGHPPPARYPREGQVVVSESGAGAYGQDITAGRHVLAADEPEPIGADSGSSPYDLLLAGLGACTSMTVRMYAQRKQWPLEKITVSLRHSRIHAEDCADCETRAGKLDRIDRVIHFDGRLDHDQRRRLLEIADKCPVHRTLRSEIVIDTVESTVDESGQALAES